MTLSLRGRLTKLKAFRDPSEAGLRSPNDRLPLTVVESAPGCWTLIDRNSLDPRWLGTIVHTAGRYAACHDDEEPAISFESFDEALSYFNDYAFALSLSQTDG